MNKLSGNYASDTEEFDRLVRVGASYDMLKKEMNISGQRIAFYYIDGFVKAELMQKLMMHFTTVKDFGDGTDGAALRFAQSSVPTVEVDVCGDYDTLSLMLMSGCSVMFAEGFGKEALIIDARTYPARDTAEPDNDRVMRGSRDGFVETSISNVTLIRRRIRDTALTVEYFCVGSESKTDVSLVYMNGKADPGYIKYLRDKLQNIKTKSLTMGHRSLIETLVPMRWYNPFPKVRATERPDAAAASILEGSVVLVCDNSPEVMILPTTLFDFLQEADDYYFPPLTGTYFRVVRHLIFLLTMILTPLWYLVVMHSPDIPAWLAFTVPEDRGGIPILLQLLLTEFAIDGLRLASLNTPDVLSSSLSVVGGLILGDFAVQVGWLCPEVIFYMAFVAIANFTQSSYELGYAFKFIRIMLLVLTALFDWYGLVAGFIVELVLVATNKTANGKRNYLYPLIPFNGKALAHLYFRLRKKE